MTRFERIAYLLSIVGLLSALLVLNGQNADLRVATSGAGAATAVEGAR